VDGGGGGHGGHGGGGSPFFVEAGPAGGDRAQRGLARDLSIAVRERRATSVDVAIALSPPLSPRGF